MISESRRMNGSLFSWLLIGLLKSLPGSSSPADTTVIPLDVLNNITVHVATCSWGPLYYDVMPALIKQHQYKRILEVGVALGGHAEALLNNTNVEQYFGVDPYRSNFDPEDQFIKTVGAYSNRSEQENCDYLYTWVKHYRLNQFGTRCKLIRATSAAAAATFTDGSLDCIFIDGDHRFSAVMQDLALWWPKLRPGGLIAGDDYAMASVAAAVNQFFAAEQKDLLMFSSEVGYQIWGVYK